MSKGVLTKQLGSFVLCWEWYIKGMRQAGDMVVS